MIVVPIPLETSIVFGPVQSRRLGRSLGINLLPVDDKVCQYDCIYCQYGRTTLKRVNPGRRKFPTVAEVLAAVESALMTGVSPDALTFAGNGEPLLHPDFAEIVHGIRQLRDRHAPLSKLALLSNGALALRSELHLALDEIDVIMLKLDAGDPLTFRHLNRPLPPITLGRLIMAERGIPNLTVQSMFVAGRVDNASGPAYDAYLNVLGMIHPACVHVYSLDRPPAEADVVAVPRSRLEAIAADIRTRLGIEAEAF